MDRISDEKRTDPERASEALAAAHVGIWEWDLLAATMYISPEWLRHMGHADPTHTIPYAEWRKRLHPDDATRFERASVEQIAGSSVPHTGEYRVRTASGTFRWLLVQGGVERNEAGAPIRFRGFHMDITERKEATQLLAIQATVMRMIAEGAPVATVLTTIAECCEMESPGMLASILVVDPDGKHVRHGAAPSLPQEYWKAIDGEPVGPCAGSCGTAVYRGKPVIVEDIATDPLWTAYAPLALAHGLRACWSTPIFDAGQRVIGTFAMYYRQPCAPLPRHELIVAMATSCAAIAISKHREEALRRRSERRFERLMQANHIGVVIGRTDGTLVEANDRYLELIGGTREELAAGTMRWDTLTPPEWRHVDEEITATIQAVGACRPVEKEYVHRDGRRMPILISVAVVDPDTGDCLSLVVDLTEQKQAESERRAMLERISDAFMAYDSEFHVTYVSEKTADIVGRRPQELIGRHFWTEFPEAVGLPVQAAYERALREQVPQHLDDYFPPFERWVEHHAYPSPTGLSVFFRDITDRKHLETQLQVSEEKFRALVEESRDVVILLDANAHLTYVSPSIRRMLGHEPAHVLGRHVQELIHADDRPWHKTIFDASMASPGPGSQVQFRVHHADGSWRNVNAYGSNWSGNAALGTFVAVWHDITDQLRAEQVLRDSVTQMRQFSQHLQEARELEQTRIAREIHDRLGQSLTMLKFGLARLVSKLPASSVALRKQGKEALNDVDATINSAREIAMDIRPPVLDDLGLAAALEWAGQRFTHHAKVPCAFSFSTEDVPGEGGRALYAIAQEALTNVARHANATHVIISLGHDDGVAQMEVRDDGRGFDATESGAPASLGMVGMRERANAVDGTFVVHSAPGHGTRVSVSVPLSGRAKATP